MRGIIIAAGIGSRMGELTSAWPKCMLPIAGKPLLEWTTNALKAAGCETVIVITGYQQERVTLSGIERVENPDYRNNNILHSWMCARKYLEGPVMVSYSNIWVEPRIHSQLAATPGGIVAAVDTDWVPYYEGRTEHPVAEAENMFLDGDGKVVSAGKHLRPEDAGGFLCGEFLGLWRMSAAGTAIFTKAFDTIDAELTPDMPFQQAAEWRRAYITDIVQHLVNQGHQVDSGRIERGWAELNTEQDYRRLPAIAARQNMTILQAALTSVQREET